MGIVTVQAFTVGGVTALPAPFTTPEWDGWLWHSYFQMHGVSAQAVGADVARNVSADLRMVIDSKAMRKISENEVLFGVLEVGVETGTAQLRYSADTRVLFKL